MTTLSEVSEVIEVGKNRANKLLAAGYQLLAVEPTSFAAEKEIAGASPMHYVRKGITYVLGRTAEQEPFPERSDAPAE